MTDWITQLYQRYVQLFGDPDEPVNLRTAQTPTEKTVSPAEQRPSS